MPRDPRPRLAALMFLEYAVQGLWVVPLAAFLMGSPHEGGLNMPARHVALIYATLAIGATLSPLIVGLIADRLFPLQRVLAVLHFVGAGLLAAALGVCVSSHSKIKNSFDSLAATALVQHRPQIMSVDRTNSWPSDELVDTPLIDLITEQQNVMRFIAAPEEYWRLKEQFPFQRFLKRHGLNVDRRVGNGLRQMPPWMFSEPNSYLDQIRSEMSPAIRNVRSDPEVLAAADRAFPPLFTLMLAYACVYMPTIPLSNVVAFRNLPDAARQYGPVRALGTIGWIAAGLLVGFAAPAVSPVCFLFAAIVSLLLAGLCLLLPHTPPTGKPRTIGDALGLPALRMLADRSFLVYVLAAFVATAVMPFHNSFANKFLVDLHVAHASAVQTLAQPTEVLGAFLIPWVWARIGIKWMLCAGLVASSVRFAMYATESVPAIVGIGFPLHGIGFALFYIAAALYVDREAPPDLRASAQGLVTVVTLGIGGLLGNWFAGHLVQWNTSGGVVDWRQVWLAPMAGTLLAAVMIAVLFRERRGFPHPPAPSPKMGEGEPE
jgi:nucleoside transporter